VISGVLTRTSLFCFVFVFYTLSFAFVSAIKLVTPEDLNETTVISTYFFCAFKSLH